MQSKCIGFRGMPSKIKPSRTPGYRTDAVLPSIAGYEITTWITYGRHSELFHQIDDISPKTMIIRTRMSRFVDAGIHAATKMLNE